MPGVPGWPLSCCYGGVTGWQAKMGTRPGYPACHPGCMAPKLAPCFPVTAGSSDCWPGWPPRTIGSVTCGCTAPRAARRRPQTAGPTLTYWSSPPTRPELRSISRAGSRITWSPCSGPVAAGRFGLLRDWCWRTCAGSTCPQSPESTDGICPNSEPGQRKEPGEIVAEIAPSFRLAAVKTARGDVLIGADLTLQLPGTSLWS